MKGDHTSVFGFVLFITGLALLTAWVILFDKENDTVKDGRLAPPTGSNMGVFYSGLVSFVSGSLVTLLGFTQMNDHLKMVL